MTGRAAAPALALVRSGREELRRLDGHICDECSIFRRRGREILRRSRDPEGCARRLRQRMQGFFNLDRGDSQLKEGKATSTIVVVVEDLMVLDSTPVADLVSN